MKTFTGNQIGKNIDSEFSNRSTTEHVDDNRESLLFDDCYLAKPDWDIANNSVELKLLHCKRRYVEAQKKLKMVQEEANHGYVILNKKWKDLYMKEEEFQESFIKFEQFVSENQDKRQRATKRIIEDVNMQTKHVENTEKVKHQLASLSLIKAKMEQKIKEYRIYEDFLTQMVTDNPLEFSSTYHVMSHYETLVNTGDEISAKHSRIMDEADAAKTAFLNLVEEKSRQLNAMNNQLVQMVTRRDEARNTTLKWENVAKEIKTIMMESICRDTDLKLCVNMLYKQMCLRQNVKPTLISNVVEQLLFIKKTMLRVKRVTQAVRRTNAKHHKLKKTTQ